MLVVHRSQQFGCGFDLGDERIDEPVLALVMVLQLAVKVRIGQFELSRSHDITIVRPPERIVETGRSRRTAAWITGFRVFGPPIGTPYSAPRRRARSRRPRSAGDPSDQSAALWLSSKPLHTPVLVTGL